MQETKMSSPESILNVGAKNNLSTISRDLVYFNVFLRHHVQKICAHHNNLVRKVSQRTWYASFFIRVSLHLSHDLLAGQTSCSACSQHLSAAMGGHDYK